MIVLDTNVLSALMRVAPEARVLAWLDEQVPDAVWTTAVTIYELQRGLELMPEGRKRRALTERMVSVLERVLRSRILPLDAEAGRVAGSLSAQRAARGGVMSAEDTLISGIVVARGATLATRNVRHFPDVPVVNPWGY